MTFFHGIKLALRKFGIDISRYPNGSFLNQVLAIKHFGINAVFDVGANDGGYARELRVIGYNGKIVSFEPINSVFQKLLSNSKNDDRWYVENIGLGAKDEKAIINISENTVSSSMLDMHPNHLRTTPNSKYVEEEEVSIFKLDSIFNKYYKKGDEVLVKIDTQGYEKYVLEGANESLDLICGIQIEISLVELYENSFLLTDVIKYMDDKGFKLFNIQNGYQNWQTGQQLQIDGTFYRKELIR